MPISKEQAREIARSFLELSHELGSYRFANWEYLTPKQRHQIEDTEWSLLDGSGSFVTSAVGITLADMENDLKAILEATAEAKKAVTTVQTVKEVLKIAAALVALGGAITSKNPGAITAAVGDLRAAMTSGTA